MAVAAAVVEFGVVEDVAVGRAGVAAAAAAAALVAVVVVVVVAAVLVSAVPASSSWIPQPYPCECFSRGSFEKPHC